MFLRMLLITYIERLAFYNIDGNGYSRENALLRIYSIIDIYYIYRDIYNKY